MNIRELIEKLEALEAEHENLLVEQDHPYFGRRHIMELQYAYARILSGRQRKPGFWQVTDGDLARGEKVVHL